MKIIIFLIMILSLTLPASALEVTLPEVSGDAADLMPMEDVSFTDGLLHVVTTAFAYLQPEIAGCIQTCALVFACAVASSILEGFGSKAVQFGSAALCAGILCAPADTLILTGTETVREISSYGKLFLPVMASALSTQGGSVTSAAIYGGTILFDSVLGSVLVKVLIPFVYAYLVAAILCAVTAGDTLKKGKELILWLMQWMLKSLIYLFTGYLTLSGVIGGTTDQVALKATKVTLSSMVPIVGGILSDASESILVSAGLIKNSVGVWGLLGVVAIGIMPFLRTGVQYLCLKVTAALCALFAGKGFTDIISDFASAMGLLLAMTGTVCLLFLISTVCFMKGMG